MSTSAAPIRRADRIVVLDTTRGIAVLGILLMNIVGFGLPDAYEDPTNWGGHEGANLAIWRINALWFEGTMRGLFTLLFGAGALLFLQRLSDSDQPSNAGRTLYFRRTLWLVAFGLVNAYLLLWEGDILFYYGIVGLILYFFRKLSARWLIVIGALILSVPTILNLREQAHYNDVRAQALAAEAAMASGDEPLPGGREAIEELRQIHEDHKPSTSKLEYAVSQIGSSYATAFHYLRYRTFYWETYFFWQYGLAECLGMMLIGMALLRAGILTGSASARTYRTMMILGYCIGLAVNLWEITRLERSGFAVATIIDTYVTYDLGRVPMTLGHVGLIGLIWLAPIWMRAKRALANVGQMALTNYLAQTIICSLIFTGAGLGLFGQLERHQLYYVVAAIWIIQLWWSGWWLRHFQFGPAEWLWRTLSYWQRQPMRIAPPPMTTTMSVSGPDSHS